jgi:hypothetical protein
VFHYDKIVLLMDGIEIMVTGRIKSVETASPSESKVKTNGNKIQIIIHEPLLLMFKNG